MADDVDIDSETDGDELPARAVARAATKRKRSRSVFWQKWSRLIHVYTSMIAFIVVLFFAVTGITLNHPTWTFGFDPSLTKTQGTLPAKTVDTNGAVDWLQVSEYARSSLDLKGHLADFGTTGTSGFISYRGPGYSADISFDTTNRKYRLTIAEQGLVAVLNDLHKGRDTESSWNWLIDVSCAFLVLVSASGIILQLFLRKRRISAFAIAAAGGVVVLIFAILTTR